MAKGKEIGRGLSSFIPDGKDLVAAFGVGEVGKMFKKAVTGKAEQAVGKFMGLSLDDEAAAMEVMADLFRQELEAVVVEKEEATNKKDQAKKKTSMITLSIEEKRVARETYDEWLGQLSQANQNRFRQIISLTKKRDNLKFLFWGMGQMENHAARTKYAMKYNWVRVSAVAALIKAINSL